MNSFYAPVRSVYRGVPCVTYLEHNCRLEDFLPRTKADCVEALTRKVVDYRADARQDDGEVLHIVAMPDARREHLAVRLFGLVSPGIISVDALTENGMAVPRDLFPSPKNFGVIRHELTQPGQIDPTSVRRLLCLMPDYPDQSVSITTENYYEEPHETLVEQAI